MQTESGAVAGQENGVDDSLIDKLGGTVRVARLFGVTPQAVTQWRRHGIPKPRRMYLELLRPDVFGLPANASDAGAQQVA